MQVEAGLMTPFHGGSESWIGENKSYCHWKRDWWKII